MKFLLSKSLLRLCRLYNQALVKALPELGLEHNVDILLALASSSHVLTQKELCAILHFDKSRVAVLIERLKQKGLIYTERNPIDRRMHFVLLTDSGRNCVPKIMEAIDKLNFTINQELDKTHLDHFYATLLKMHSNLGDVAD